MAFSHYQDAMQDNRLAVIFDEMFPRLANCDVDGCNPVGRSREILFQIVWVVVATEGLDVFGLSRFRSEIQKKTDWLIDTVFTIRKWFNGTLMSVNQPQKLIQKMSMKLLAPKNQKFNRNLAFWYHEISNAQLKVMNFFFYFFPQSCNWSIGTMRKKIGRFRNENLKCDYGQQ